MKPLNFKFLQVPAVLFYTFSAASNFANVFLNKKMFGKYKKRLKT